MMVSKALLEKIGVGLACGALALSALGLAACTDGVATDDEGSAVAGIEGSAQVPDATDDESAAGTEDAADADDASGEEGAGDAEADEGASGSGEEDADAEGTNDSENADGSEGTEEGSEGQAPADGDGSGGAPSGDMGEAPSGGGAPGGDAGGSGDSSEGGDSSSDGDSSGDGSGGAPSGDMGEAPSGGGAPGGDAGGSGDSSEGGDSSGDAGGSGGTPSGDAAGGDAMGGGDASGGGADTMSFDYSGTYTGVLSADGEEVSESSGTYEATESDQNAALVQNGGQLLLESLELVKAGDDTDGDRCNFYGCNSILLSVGDGSLATVQDVSLSATSEGSNGIFATDSGTVYATDFSISTTADNSRGLDATYGGTIIASNATIETQGSHCAGVASDRGGGYISLVDATVSTAGSGSPILYSTGDIEVSGITGTATGSQICGMEGTNTILINSSTLTSTVTGATASDPVADGVIIYQSTSGDAEASTGSTATFQVANSTLASSIESGSMFYFTNTSADVVVASTTLDFDSSAANLILAAGNDANNWGSAGSNGASVTFTAIQQTLEGTVEADTISSVALYLTDSSTWTGKALISDNAAGASTSEAPLCVYVDESSTWVVTESCTLSALVVADGGAVVDEDGDAVTIVDADGSTLVEGSGSVTVTVNGTYSTDYDASGAGALTTELIDRSDFDSTFDMSTVFTMGEGTAVEASASTESSSEIEGLDELLEFFSPLIEAFKEAWAEAQGTSTSDSADAAAGDGMQGAPDMQGGDMQGGAPGGDMGQGGPDASGDADSSGGSFWDESSGDEAA